MVDSPYLVRAGSKVKLAKVDAEDGGPFKDKDEAQEAMRDLLDRLTHLQGLLYAEGRQALLIVLQGMDTSGKDGTIRCVFSGLNPQGCAVVSFKKPSPTELSHDYLWRIHAHAPARGMIAIFNRSHYESVLVERVRELVPKGVWSKRYEHINDFEKLLADEGTRIVKFFLHISYDEQKERLQSRLEDPEKRWKFDPADLAERKLWGNYLEAYEDALAECSTKRAPWYIIPANRKWYRNWLVADILVRTLEDMDPKYPPPPPGLDRLKVV